MPGMLLIHLCCSRKGLPPFAMLSEVLTLRRHRASACFEETAVRSFRIAWSRLLAAYAKWSYQHPAISQQTPHLRRFSPTQTLPQLIFPWQPQHRQNRAWKEGYFLAKGTRQQTKPAERMNGAPCICCSGCLAPAAMPGCRGTQGSSSRLQPKDIGTTAPTALLDAGFETLSLVFAHQVCVIHLTPCPFIFSKISMTPPPPHLCQSQFFFP